MAARGDTDRGGETRMLREIILEHMSTRIGKSSMDLSIEVREDFGEVGQRRFLRQISWLVQVGCARRDQEWDLELGWFRPIYFLIHRRLPGGGRPWCRKCGLIGAMTGACPTHRRIVRNIEPLLYMPQFISAPRRQDAQAREAA